MVFSFTCYFVINGFLYNEDYISKLLHKEGQQSFIDYIMDSIERIIYSSLAGGFISFIIGIIFISDKKIEDTIEREKENKILLKGEISKIYKCNNKIIMVFAIAQFFVLAFFNIYVFCFCYVYPNSIKDWCKSSLIVIGLIQFFFVFASFLISFTKYLSVKCNWKLCYTINSFLEDKL